MEVRKLRCVLRSAVCRANAPARRLPAFRARPRHRRQAGSGFPARWPLAHPARKRSQALDLLGVLTQRVPLGRVRDGQALDGASRAVGIAAGHDAVVRLVRQAQLRLRRVHGRRHGCTAPTPRRCRRAPAVGMSAEGTA